MAEAARRALRPRPPGPMPDGCERGAVSSLALGIVFLAGCAGDRELDRPEPLGDAVPIEYPLEMWDRGIEGETVLRVRVDEEGGVDSVTVVETSGHDAFDSAAVEGARVMRFHPGRRGGRDVPVWVRIPVHFAKPAGPSF